jgi:hypothetical protein
LSRAIRFCAGTTLLAFVLALGIGTLGAVGSTTALGASTSLTIVSGDVSVRRGAGAFVPAAGGQILIEGDTIRTGPDARAILTYFEGSTVTIDPGTELRIDNAWTNADGGTVVVMTQALGRTWHVVTKLMVGSSKYEVKTPASTASVRGTQFQVDADANATRVATSEGTVVAKVQDPAAPGRWVDVAVTAGTTQTQVKNASPAPARRAAEQKVKPAEPAAPTARRSVAARPSSPRGAMARSRRLSTGRSRLPTRRRPPHRRRRRSRRTRRPRMDRGARRRRMAGTFSTGTSAAP